MTSKTTVLAVVIFLGVFAIAALAGVVYLIHDGASDGSIAIVSGGMGTALGALAGILATTRTEPADPGVGVFPGKS